jgi:hypothetical protein
MALSPPEWILRQLSPNFFSLQIGNEEAWVHFLPFSGRRQLVDAGVYQYLAGTGLTLPRREVAGESCFTLPTQRLAIFHPPLFGKAVDFREPDDRIGVVRFLAEFHSAMRGYVPETRPHTTLGRLIAHWERRLQRLYEFARLARFRIYQGVLDRVFLEQTEMIADGIRAGLNGLRQADYLAQCHAQGQICYFHFQSKLFWRTAAGIAPWHFAYCHWDLPVFDLYRYLMEVGRGGFSSEETDRLLTNYRQIRPLSVEEKTLLRVFFLFPERLYRLFSAFYLNRTTRAPRRLIDRVAREVQANIERQRIIQKIGDVGEQ